MQLGCQDQRCGRHSCMHAFVHSSIHSFIHSFVHHNMVVRVQPGPIGKPAICLHAHLGRYCQQSMEVDVSMTATGPHLDLKLVFAVLSRNLIEKRTLPGCCFGPGLSFVEKLQAHIHYRLVCLAACVCVRHLSRRPLLSVSLSFGELQHKFMPGHLCAHIPSHDP